MTLDCSYTCASNGSPPCGCNLGCTEAKADRSSVMLSGPRTTFCAAPSARAPRFSTGAATPPATLGPLVFLRPSLLSCLPFSRGTTRAPSPLREPDPPPAEMAFRAPHLRTRDVATAVTPISADAMLSAMLRWRGRWHRCTRPVYVPGARPVFVPWEGERRRFCAGNTASVYCRGRSRPVFVPGGGGGEEGVAGE